MRTKIHFRLIILMTALFSSISLLSFVFPNGEEDMKLELNFSGLDEDKNSQVMIAVYTEPNNFLGDKPFKTFKAATNGKTNFSHEINLPKGKYGIAFFQDLNGDEKLNKNFVGIPSEPYAFSNNAPATFGPPKWSDAVFEFGMERSMNIDF